MIDIFQNYEIKNESTFKIGGTVKQVAFPYSVDELVDLLKTDEYDFVLGGCSNVLFSSECINKKIIITKKVKEFSIDDNIVNVSAGTVGALVARECLKNSLTGFEFLIGFPGCFGGMICMNASAHNQSIADNFISATVYNPDTKTIEVFDKDKMDFSYRKSILSDSKYVVLSAKFQLTKGDYAKIEDTMMRNIEFRKTRQPSLKYPNAGSTFKNPTNDSAGRLLDLCEMKGVKVGGAMVFDKHANFVINYDNATSMDVITLMYQMYSKVREKYIIEMQPEIKYVGNTGTKEYRLWEIMSTENTQAIQK